MSVPARNPTGSGAAALILVLLAGGSNVLRDILLALTSF